MINLTKTLATSLATILLLAGCAEKEPEITEADVKAAAETATKETQAKSDKNLESKLAAGLKNVKEDSKAALNEAKAELESKMKGELAKKLVAQKEALTKQFTASNKALRSQVDSLMSKFNSLKNKLPESIIKPLTEKLPQLNTSIASLESLVSKFNPSSLEQVAEFKTKYEKELAIAKKVRDEVMKLLANTKVGDMLKKIPSL